MSAAHEQYIRNLQASIAQHQRIVDANLPEAPQARGIIARLSADLAAAEAVRGGGGGSTSSAPAAPTGPSAETIRQNKAAKAFLVDLFSSWGGMGDLIDEVDRLVKEYGNQPQVLEAEVRTLEPYKKRFAGLIRLRENGITDVRNETQYIDLERDYREVFREAGMRDFLGTDGTQEQFDAIAELVADYSVSVNEVKARIGDAARLVSNPDNLEAAALRDYYGIDTTTLTEYVLDPERTMNRINDIANTALMGAQAARQGLNIDEDAAGRLAAVAGEGDLVVGQYQQTLTNAVELRDEASRLAKIEGIDLTDSEALLSSANLDQDAKKKTSGLRSRERARFSGGSGVSGNSLSSARG